MIEDPAHHRRYFIEYETGSATIYDAKKSTSTRAKVDRYEAFFRGNAHPLQGRLENEGPLRHPERGTSQFDRGAAREGRLSHKRRIRCSRPHTRQCEAVPEP